MHQQKLASRQFTFNSPNPLVLKYAFSSSGGRALDIGAGCGHNSRYLAETLKYEVDALDSKKEGMIDPPEDILTHLAQYGEENHLPINTWELDVRDFSFKAEEYELVIAMGSLQCIWNDLPLVASGISDTILPGGRFICGLITQTIDISGEIPLELTAQANPFSLDVLKEIFRSLKIIHAENKWLYNPPHRGANYSHVHSFIEFVADKPSN